ncbi:MAG: tRNA 2-thiouridine(34) synthase MnmA [Ruminococcaceae bacterium]|nr:tRNA 2-thiouridine(34) synthase MnmA [Oscillospiraceae bacterium]
MGYNTPEQEGRETVSEHVFVGMSGGVDSSVAAALLLQAGCQVSGINARMLGGVAETGGACGSQRDTEDAAAVARRLGIPFHVVDLSEPFRNTVIQNFISEYERGRTPNPCAVCNRHVKFGALLEQVRALGGDAIATGHYARVRFDEISGRYQLLRGADRKKDQSYFLYALTQAQLSRVRFPLGGLEKQQVRQIAEELGLVNAAKRDSQDICFVPNGKYAEFIEQTAGKTFPFGDFLDGDGRVLGRHKGIIRYTLGQHKGLGLSTETPLYVLEKNAADNTIRLGPDSALWSHSLTAERMNWIAIPALTEPVAVTVKTRYTQQEAAAVAEPMADGRVRVVFDEPQRAVTAGQVVALYDGDVVVGGGIICDT